MTLRTFLRWWLRGLRPTRRTPAPVEPLSYRYRSIEALMMLPTVEADRSRHLYSLGTADIVTGAHWLAEQYPDTYAFWPPHLLELQAGIWLGLRADVQRERIV